MAKTPWFGNLLDWQWDPQTAMHTAWHGGRSHYILKLDRQSADAKHTSRGWHILAPDDYDQLDIGPHLGNDVGTAKLNAEARIVCDDTDLTQYPQLSTAIYSGSAYYEGLIAARDDEHQRFTVWRQRESAPFAAIRPVFLGRGGAVSIRWRAVGLPAETLISGHSTWREAFDALLGGGR